MMNFRVTFFSATYICGLVLLPSASRAAESATGDLVNPDKVLEWGNKKDRTKVQNLRRLKARREKHRHSLAANAQMALAKVGERAEMDEIIAETKSNDPAVQAYAIEKLSYVGNNEAIRNLIGLLDDMRIRRGLPEKGADGKMHDSDVGFGPPSYAAIKALIKLIPGGPRLKGKYPSKDDAAAWKTWWSANKEKFE
jgi:hypothetical protein